MSLPPHGSGSAAPSAGAGDTTHPVGLVTGGGRGIGLAVVRAWARRGVVAGVVDREAQAQPCVEALCLAEGSTCAFYTADVRDHARAQEVVDDLWRRYGRLDYLVLNAGVARDRVSWKMSEEEWDEVLAVNLKGAFNYVRAAAPRLRDQGFGRLVFVSSINALRGKFGQSSYAASKAGLIGLARTLAVELGPAGITVNVVAPGMVRTGMTSALPEPVLARARAESLLGRIGDPEDVAAAVDFLCRPESRHITGAVLRVDGGQALAAESA
jgi:NAD(P)-dependent dehydrogenase (short-subunit alcohol dehydrogenase family)